ncbi:DJ-1/PfpI family protein [Mycoplasmopsis edwardii]|uniref:DJ-1/PfpI family protein n=1 Tax=Mycoplasmopsis edwardii TaxID=53558 RepID=A0ACD4PHI1_9BACT|nr:DJ-1/PfpI family protein [Mycoplasmopsis edwardii]WBP84035.1 DJ-1/PfpI family protein [Mycoplasmopsis edwardii]
MNLLVIIENNFKDVELVTPLTIFKTSKQFNKIDFYNPTLKVAKGSDGFAFADNILNEVNIDDYDLIFIPGGSGAQALRKNDKSLNIIKDFYKKEQNKIIAVCDAPNVLSEKSIITNEEFSGYPTDWSIDFRNSNWQDNLVSISKNKLYTGNSPYSSAKLAFIALIEIFGYKIALSTYKIFAGKPEAKEIIL